MMNQLESDLNEALSRQASRLPAEAGVRLRHVDYHPRTSRISPRLTVGSLAGVAASTGVIVSVVVLGGSTPAFAGWTPSPTPASTGQTSAADAACRAQLASAPAMPGVASTDGAWSVVASDVRGPFTLVIYQSGGTDATCLIGPSITIVSRSNGHGGSMSASGGATGTGPRQAGGSIMVGGTGTGSIKHLSVAHLDSASQGPYTLVDGQVDPGVTAVTLVRTQGDPVRASTVNGLFVAWWPGSQDATSADITSASRVTTQSLNTSRPIPPPANDPCQPDPQATSSTVVCSGRASGTSPGGPSTALPG